MEKIQVKSYSQNQEDIFILNYFGSKPGTLLSIGENNGIDLSNAKLLIEHGWNAHLVEPGRVCGDLLKLHGDNPRVHIYNYGIGPKDEQVTFWESGAHIPNGSDRGLVSTADFEETKRWPNVEFTERQIDIATFDTFWHHADKPCFDFISIDAEGFDLQILQQIDLSLTSCLVIEWNSITELKARFEIYCATYGLKLALVNSENLIFIK